MMFSSRKHYIFTLIFRKNKGKNRGSGWFGHFCLIALLGLGGLGGAPALGAANLSPQEEAALFSLADLGPVDLSPKTVTVEVFVSPNSELDACRRMLPLAWERVQQFYARMGVNLVYAEGRPEPGALARTQRLRVELLPHKEWLNRSFKAFNVEPPFRLRFLQVCRDKCAFAHLPLSIIHISFKRFEETELKDSPGKTGQNRDWLANLLVHELGHLMGLYHTDEFTNDKIPEVLPDKTPNFMSQRIAFKSRLGFVERQKLMVHSYLSQGKVYRQYEQVDFDPLRYLEKVRVHNGFRERAPQKTKTAPDAKGRSQPRTFDDDDEDDED
ncbi:MAG: hypothetical protein FJ126_07380 [Deltaproteobacteria bacterium]|nr:hypothetical protein [Deltaproteobacteria bacterium]